MYSESLFDFTAAGDDQEGYPDVRFPDVHRTVGRWEGGKSNQEDGESFQKPWEESRGQGVDDSQESLQLPAIGKQQRSLGSSRSVDTLHGKSSRGYKPTTSSYTAQKGRGGRLAQASTESLGSPILNRQRRSVIPNGSQPNLSLRKPRQEYKASSGELRSRGSQRSLVHASSSTASLHPVAAGLAHSASLPRLGKARIGDEFALKSAQGSELGSQVDLRDSAARVGPSPQLTPSPSRRCLNRDGLWLPKIPTIRNSGGPPLVVTSYARKLSKSRLSKSALFTFDWSALRGDTVVGSWNPHDTSAAQQVDNSKRNTANQSKHTMSLKTKQKRSDDSARPHPNEVQARHRPQLSLRSTIVGSQSVPEMLTTMAERGDILREFARARQMNSHIVSSSGSTTNLGSHRRRSDSNPYAHLPRGFVAPLAGNSSLPGSTSDLHNSFSERRREAQLSGSYSAASLNPDNVRPARPDHTITRHLRSQSTSRLLHQYDGSADEQQTFDEEAAAEQTSGIFNDVIILDASGSVDHAASTELKDSGSDEGRGAQLRSRVGNAHPAMMKTALKFRPPPEGWAGDVPPAALQEKWGCVDYATGAWRDYAGNQSDIISRQNEFRRLHRNFIYGKKYLYATKDQEELGIDLHFDAGDLPKAARQDVGVSEHTAGAHDDVNEIPEEVFGKGASSVKVSTKSSERPLSLDQATEAIRENLGMVNLAQIQSPFARQTPHQWKGKKSTHFFSEVDMQAASSEAASASQTQLKTNRTSLDTVESVVESVAGEAKTESEQTETDDHPSARLVGADALEIFGGSKLQSVLDSKLKPHYEARKTKKVGSTALTKTSSSPADPASEQLSNGQTGEDFGVTEVDILAIDFSRIFQSIPHALLRRMTDEQRKSIGEFGVLPIEKINDSEGDQDDDALVLWNGDDGNDGQFAYLRYIPEEDAIAEAQQAGWKNYDNHLQKDFVAKGCEMTDRVLKSLKEHAQIKEELTGISMEQIGNCESKFLQLMEVSREKNDLAYSKWLKAQRAKWLELRRVAKYQFELDRRIRLERSELGHEARADENEGAALVVEQTESKIERERLKHIRNTFRNMENAVIRWQLRRLHVIAREVQSIAHRQKRLLRMYIQREKVRKETRPGLLKFRLVKGIDLLKTPRGYSGRFLIQLGYRSSQLTKVSCQTDYFTTSNPMLLANFGVSVSNAPLQSLRIFYQLMDSTERVQDPVRPDVVMVGGVDCTDLRSTVGVCEIPLSEVLQEPGGILVRKFRINSEFFMENVKRLQKKLMLRGGSRRTVSRIPGSSPKVPKSRLQVETNLRGASVDRTQGASVSQRKGHVRSRTVAAVSSNPALDSEQSLITGSKLLAPGKAGHKRTVSSSGLRASQRLSKPPSSRTLAKPSHHRSRTSSTGRSGSWQRRRLPKLKQAYVVMEMQMLPEYHDSHINRDEDNRRRLQGRMYRPPAGYTPSKVKHTIATSDNQLKISEAGAALVFGSKARQSYYTSNKSPDAVPTNPSSTRSSPKASTRSSPKASPRTKHRSLTGSPVVQPGSLKGIAGVSPNSGSRSVSHSRRGSFSESRRGSPSTSRRGSISAVKGGEDSEDNSGPESQSRRNSLSTAAGMGSTVAKTDLAHLYPSGKPCCQISVSEHRKDYLQVPSSDVLRPLGLGVAGIPWIVNFTAELCASVLHRVLIKKHSANPLSTHPRKAVSLFHDEVLSLRVPKLPTSLQTVHLPIKYVFPKRGKSKETESSSDAENTELVPENSTAVVETGTSSHERSVLPKDADESQHRASENPVQEEGGQAVAPPLKLQVPIVDASGGEEMLAIGGFAASEICKGEFGVSPTVRLGKSHKRSSEAKVSVLPDTSHSGVDEGGSDSWEENVVEDAEGVDADYATQANGSLLLRMDAVSKRYQQLISSLEHVSSRNEEIVEQVNGLAESVHVVNSGTGVPGFSTETDLVRKMERNPGLQADRWPGLTAEEEARLHDNQKQSTASRALNALPSPSSKDKSAASQDVAISHATSSSTVHVQEVVPDSDLGGSAEQAVPDRVLPDVLTQFAREQQGSSSIYSDVLPTNALMSDLIAPPSTVTAIGARLSREARMRSFVNNERAKEEMAKRVKLRVESGARIDDILSDNLVDNLLKNLSPDR